MDDTRYTSRRDNEKRVEYDWRGDGALQKSFVTATYVKVPQKKNCLSSCNTSWSFLPNPVVGMQVRIELSHIVILRVRNVTCVVRSNQIVTPYLESGKRSVISRCRQHSPSRNRRCQKLLRGSRGCALPSPPPRIRREVYENRRRSCQVAFHTH